tara:strand:- start:1031 stop:2332 length:1302 start_codon:yes stop_codon:yes gene_type:complete
MSAAGPSNYEVFNIRKPKTGQVTGVEGRVLNFNYYESIYSPMITGRLMIEDTGGTIENEKGLLSTIKDGMKITGFEEVSFKIATAFGDLNFTDYPLIVTGSPATKDESNRQTLILNLVSKTEMISSSKPLSRNYPESPISDTVQKILNKELKISEDKLDIEKTQNQDKIKGNHRGALDVIQKICKKSIPAEGKDPGYFFFETQDGFNFKSIDGLIKEGIKRFEDDATYASNHTYFYFGALVANLEKDINPNDFKVLIPPVIRRDEDQLQALRNGLYNVRIITKNSLTGEYKEEVKNLLSDTNLGEKQEKPVEDNVYFKTYAFHINPGENNPGVSDTILNNPANYVPQANMRYSLLHTQIVQIQIPCNVQLRAGQVIRLLLENITQSNKNEQIYNELRSGFYMICHLSHTFTPNNSFTSLTLLRDTRELYTSKK